LPNITEEFNFHKREALAALQRQDYQRATSAIKTLNECLGEDYMIEISTSKYDDELKTNTTYQCNFCTMDSEVTVNKGDEDEKTKTIQVPTEIPVKDIRKYKVKLNDAQSFFLKSKTKECWTCSSCSKQNDMRKTVRVVPKRQQPFFLKVVSDPPVRTSGIASRRPYRKLYNNWFNNFMEEITWSMVLYRTEWKSQNDGEEMGGYQDKGDGS
jgi:hypothetical protein